MKPIDVPTRETTNFIKSHAKNSEPVLEIGCGSGDVAVSLMSHGFSVVGIDSSKEAVERARSRGVNAVCASWPEFDSELVGTIAFTRSFHHIPNLPRSVRKANDLLKREGVLLIEDFAYHEADRKTIEWFVDTLRTLAGKEDLNLVPEEFVTKMLAAKDVFHAWQEDHDHDLHTMAAMTEAVEEIFEVRETQATPYLYRYLVPVLPETPKSVEILVRVFEAEVGLGMKNSIVLIGRRIVASPI